MTRGELFKGLSVLGLIMIISSGAESAYGPGSQIDPTFRAPAPTQAKKEKNYIQVAQVSEKTKALHATPTKVDRIGQQKNCETHIFEVNDYGKVGPIKFARENLQKYVDQVKKQRNLRQVKVVEGEPKCWKFLDFGFFDEWTCSVKAAICW